MSSGMESDSWETTMLSLQECQALGHERGQHYVDTGRCDCPHCRSFDAADIIADMRDAETRARCECGNVLTIADAPPLCGQCRRGRFGGRAPKVRVMSAYEREQRLIERRRGYR